MQQQQRQANQLAYIPIPNEDQVILQRLIKLLQNKQRKPIPQFQTKSDQDENYFETLLECKENGSHYSQLSSDTYSTYISINISDYEARILKKLLEGLLREFLLQQSDYEKNQKVYSDLQQQQQVSYLIEPNKNSNSDVIQSNQQENSFEEINPSKSKKSKNQKILTTKQLLPTLMNLQKKYQKYLTELMCTKETNNSFSKMNFLIKQIPKFKNQQQLMHEDNIIFEQCRLIMDENEQTFQKYDLEIYELNPLLKK